MSGRHIANKILFHVDADVLAHATNVSFDAARESVEVTSRTDGDFAEFLYGQTVNFSGNNEAFLDWDPTTGENYQKLWDAMINKTLIDIEITTGEAGHKKITGKALVTNLSGFGGSGEGASFTVEWQGTGTVATEDVTT